MRKSKYIYIILAIIYAFVALLYPLNIFAIRENLIFALSISALLISLGDVVSKIIRYLCIENEYNAFLKTTIDFLNTRIDSGLTNTRIINVRNVREYYINELKDNYVFCHPIEYSKKHIFCQLNNLSLALFILGIVSFILIPFIGTDISYSMLNSIVAILAFSAIILSLFLDELINEKQVNKDTLIYEKHLVINAEYPEFKMYFDYHMYYRNDLLAVREIQDKSGPE